MPPLIDLTGQKFNHLFVIKRAANIGRYTAWLCECDCEQHNLIIVRGADLKNGHTKSCGCQKKQATIKYNNKERNKTSIINQNFGKLFVLEETDLRTQDRKVLYKCICNCGNPQPIYTTKYSLVSGHTQSCGCLKSKGEEKIIQLLRENNISFETQKQFDNCVFPSGKKAKFDFYVNNQYIIEFDGKQHFVETGWNNAKRLEESKQRDEFKNIYCFNNNIPIIRIPYTHLNNLSLKDLDIEQSQFIISCKR